LQWLVHSRDSLQRVRRYHQAFSLCTLSDPTNQLPTSLSLAGPTATGRLHCSHHNFLRVAHATLYCKRDLLDSQARTQLFKTISGSGMAQVPKPVESGCFCGKVLRCFPRHSGLAFLHGKANDSVRRRPTAYDRSVNMSGRAPEKLLAS
jgi:hypothetical protein